MTRIVRRTGAPARVGARLAMFVIVGAAFTLAGPPSAEAAKISRFLTHQDLAGRMVLDQNGQQIQLPTASDRHPELAKGSTPTYLAIPLQGGEHLPASIPILETGTQQGANPVGPLNFDAVVEANLNTTLASSRLAVVNTPSQSYLVEYLPRRKQSPSIATSTVNELSHLITNGPTQLSKLTQSGMNDLEKFLHISSKTASSTPILNLQAQVLGSDGLPSAVPEPTTWLILTTLLVGGAILRRRLPRGR